MPYDKSDSYPKQSKNVNKPVYVCFNYDTTNTISGICLREDIEDPYLTILQLEDGKTVLATECQWRPK